LQKACTGGHHAPLKEVEGRQTPVPKIKPIIKNKMSFLSFVHIVTSFLPWLPLGIQWAQITGYDNRGGGIRQLVLSPPG
jgi:hypothetical protein